MGKSIITLFSKKSDIRSKWSSKHIRKLKTLLGLAVARIAILKNKHQTRCRLAHSDIAQLLTLSQFDRAVRRAEIVVREEDLLDVFVIVQSYCHLIIERSLLLSREKDCPDELQEAVSSLIYVSSRSAEMPELQHVRGLFSAMFGSEIVRAAIELRSCSVNPKIVQKLSTKKPTLESRVRIVEEIGAERGITLNIEDSKSSKVSPNSTKNNNTGQKEETALGSDKLHKETNPDSADASFKENKPSKFVPRGSTENDEKNAQGGSETEKQSNGLSHIPWYQNARNRLRESFKRLLFREGGESETSGLLDSTDDADILKSYYSETTRPGTETAGIDFAKKSPVRDSKVTRKMAVSVRTRP